MNTVRRLLPAVLLCVILCLTLHARAQQSACGNNSKYGVSAPPITCPYPGLDFLNPYTGNVQRTITDLRLWGSVGDLPMIWNRYYTSRGNILWNFSFVYAMYDGPMIGGQPSIVIDYPEGGQNSFIRSATDPTAWLPLPGIDKRLDQHGSEFILQMSNGFRYRFVKHALVIGPNSYFYYLLNDIRDSRQNLYRLTYTVNRQLDSVIEPAGRFFKVHYTSLGNRRLIGQVNTGDGRSVRYEYDIYNDGVSKWIRFVRARYGDSTRAEYSYVQSSPGVSLRLSSASDPRFEAAATRMRYTYEWSIAAGYFKEERNLGTGALISSMTTTDSSRTVCYANGRQQVFIMPPAMLGNVSRYTDGLGRATQYSHALGGLGFLAAITDPLGRSTNYHRTNYGNPLRLKYADSSTERWVRDSLDRIEVYTDELGRMTTYSFDSLHRIIRIHHPDSTTDSFSYNNYGQVLAHRHPNGGTDQFTYDSRGLKLSHRDPLGHLKAFSYDAADRLASKTDALGRTTSFEYNERGKLTKITNPDLSVQSYAYDSFGNRTARSDESGHTWSTSYDEFRRPVTKTDPQNRTTHYAYDLPGGLCACAHKQNLPGSMTLPGGQVTRYQYDVEWQRSSLVQGANTSDSAQTTYEYDMVGNRLKRIDPRGNEWLAEYDLRDRLSAEEDPLGHRRGRHYDSAGNLISVLESDSSVTAYAYDAMNRRIRRTDPANQVTRYTYDAGGNLDSLIDAKGNTYLFRHDLLNRKTRMTYPDASFERYSYDGAGNLDTFINRSGVFCRYAYDSRDREILSDWSDATPDVIRTYDLEGRLLSITNSACTLSYSYDNAHQLLSETQRITGSGAGGKTTTYAYKADGLRNSLIYPGGTALSFSYTSRNQIESIDDGASVALVRYEYDLNGNRISKVMRNGTVTANNHDDDNRLLTTQHGTGSNSFSRFDYGYDDRHRRRFMQRDMGKGDVYSYDAIGQLTDVSVDAVNPGTVPSAAAYAQSFSMDAAGNRVSVTDSNGSTAYCTNNLNQYVSVDSNLLTYSADGNLSSHNGWSFSYDAQNRLTGATNGSTAIDLAYDGRNRCVQRTTNGAPIYRYYDGWNLIEERDAADLLKQRYVHGARLDELITKTASGTSLYFHHDALGNVVGLSDSLGAIVEQYRYDVFGTPATRDAGGMVISASAFGNRFLFTGREYIREPGLYDYRNRIYAPGLGRFVQPDPLLFNAGDDNLYRYVRNDPVNAKDPDGRAEDLDEDENRMVEEYREWLRQRQLNRQQALSDLFQMLLNGTFDQETVLKGIAAILAIKLSCFPPEWLAKLPLPVADKIQQVFNFGSTGELLPLCIDDLPVDPLAFGATGGGETCAQRSSAVGE